MKRRYKILLFFITHIILMLVVPFLAVELSVDYCGMGFSMLMFFIVYPILRASILLIPLLVLFLAVLKILWFLLLLLLIPALLIIYQEFE